MVTQNRIGEKLKMCSRGQILLEIHDAIAMVAQNRDLSLFPDHYH